MQKTLQVLSTIILVIFFLCTFKSEVNAASDLVNPNQQYTYEEMVTDIKKLANQYPSIIKYKVIGKSEFGRDIYAISLGTGTSTVFINGSHHAREWLTTNLNMYMIDQYAQAYVNNEKMGNYNVHQILTDTTIWFVPMVNPDGVTLQQQGLNAFPESIRSSLLIMNDNQTDFSRWKANAMGVDLNRQYDADWANIKNDPGKPYWQNYKGTAPHTAAETKAVVNFTYEIDPEMAVAYHSAGKILYWNFHQTSSLYNRDLSYAKDVGYLTGYSLVFPGPNPSGGGFTDWFITKFKRPGLTPEIGVKTGETSLPISQFSQTWIENKYVGLYVAQKGYALYKAKHPYQNVKINIDGVEQNFDQPGVLYNNTTFVPLRGVFEVMGANVTWESSNQSITIYKNLSYNFLKVGANAAILDGEKVYLDQAPRIINSRSMVPLRVIATSLGATVTWDGTTQTVYINSKSEGSLSANQTSENTVQ